MVFDKILFSSLIFLLLPAMVFAADVGIDFTLVNAPPTIDLTLAPLGPNPGTITFSSDATYHDIEMQPGTVNFTWYVGGATVQPGGFYPAVAPDGTVSAILFTLAATAGQTVSICVDASDGTNPPVNTCRSTAVLTPGTDTNRGQIDISALGGACVYSPIELKFSRTGSAAGAFSLFIRRPDGTTETIPITASRESYTYVPDQTGAYYFGAIDAGNCDVTGASVTVGEIVPVVRMPVCSFMETPPSTSLSPTGDPVTVYIVDNHGVVQQGMINVSWPQDGLPQSVSQSGGTLSFVPRSLTAHQIVVRTPECIASMNFTPNACFGNKTINDTIQYTMENKTFYIWLLPSYLNVTRTCSPVSCNMTADCCEGYCLRKKCVIPRAPEEPWLMLRAGCYGMLECTDQACEVICNLIWLAIVSVSAYAAYLRRRYRDEALLMFMVPLFVAIVMFPAAGLVAAVGAAGAALYRKKTEEKKAGVK